MKGLDEVKILYQDFGNDLHVRIDYLIPFI